MRHLGIFWEDLVSLRKFDSYSGHVKGFFNLESNWLLRGWLIVTLGVQTPEHLKSRIGEEAFNDDGLVQRSIRLLKDDFPDLEASRRSHILFRITIRLIMSFCLTLSVRNTSRSPDNCYCQNCIVVCCQLLASMLLTFLIMDLDKVPRFAPPARGGGGGIQKR